MEDTQLEAERFLVRRWGVSSPDQIARQLCRAWRFGQKLQGKESSAMDPMQVTQKVLDCLTALGATYVVGGSVASSLYGEPRFTQDTDIMTQLTASQLPRLIQALESEFYVSEPAAREAIRLNSSFNLIHFDSQYKVDLFVSKNREFDLSRFARRQVPEGFPDNFWVSSAEDMVLVKLEWYRLGKQPSDRQWRDILSILAVRHGRLDNEYLLHWSRVLGLNELLEKALAQVHPLTEP